MELEREREREIPERKRDTPDHSEIEDPFAF